MSTRTAENGFTLIELVATLAIIGGAAVRKCLFAALVVVMVGMVMLGSARAQSSDTGTIYVWNRWGADALIQIGVFDDNNPYSIANCTLHPQEWCSMAVPAGPHTVRAYDLNSKLLLEAHGSVNAGGWVRWCVSPNQPGDSECQRWYNSNSPSP